MEAVGSEAGVRQTGFGKLFTWAFLWMPTASGREDVIAVALRSVYALRLTLHYVAFRLLDG